MPSRPSSPGPKPSAAVYRRRRLVAALLALILLLLVGWGLWSLIRLGMGALSGDDAEPSVSAPPTPVHSPSPAPPSGATPGAASPTVALEDAAACQPSDLRLVASADKAQYLRGEEAVLRLSVTNLSSSPCRADVGTARQEFTVRTAEGDDVFSTRVCQADPTSSERVLTPHEELTAVYRWSGHASNEDCGTPGALAAAGPHLLTVTLGEQTSRPVALRIQEEAAPGAWDGASSGAPASGSPAPSTPASPSASPSATGSAPAVSSPAAPSASAASSVPAPASGSPAAPTPASSPAAPSVSPSR